jgi:hypothetical protein
MALTMSLRQVSPHSRLLSKVPSIAAYGLLAGCLWYLGSSLMGYAIDGDHAKESFLILREMRMQPTFADLKWITVIGECGTKLQTIYQSAAASCAAYGYGTHGGGFPESGYPPIATWLLRWLQFPARQSAALAVVSGVTFVVVLLIVSKGLFRSTWAWPLWLSMILVSFPVQLVLERANLDILIFLALAATAACISMKNRAAWLPSGLLALLAVSLKVYPVAGFAGWLAFGQVAESHGWQVSRAVKAAILSGCVIGLSLSLPWMFGSVELHGEGGMNSFGLKALGYINAPLGRQIGVGASRWVIRGLIITKLLALVVGAALTARVRLSSSLQHHFQAMGDGHCNNSFQTFFLIMSWTWLGCYILTISYDYRHIFMLPSLFLLLSMVDRRVDLDPHQYTLAWILIAASMTIILFPHAHYNGLSFYEVITGFCELSKEIVIIPFYAGALTMLLTRHRFRQRSISALVLG